MEQVSAAFFGDAAVDRDLLGYGPYAAALAEHLSSPHLPTPYCVGVYGSWGTGKSSFMAMVRRELGATHTLWFQPWLFDEKEEVWKALIHTTLQYLEQVSRRDQTLFQRVAPKIRDLVTGVGRVTLNAALQAHTGGTVDLDRIAELWAANEHDATQFLNTFRSKFADLKDEILGDGSAARLVVFVDDLDRCTPDGCVMALEAIKLFFDMPDCAFVLALDRQVVQQGITAKYDGRMPVSGERYLEKLIQLPFHLPPITPNVFDDFLALSTAELEFDRATLELLSLASERNPRRAKRFLDTAQLVQGVFRRLPVHEVSLGPSDVASLLVLQVAFPPVFQWLVTHGVGPADFSGESKQVGELRSRLVTECEQRHGGDGLALAERFLEMLATNKFPTAVAGPQLRGYMAASAVVEIESPSPPIRTLDMVDASLRYSDGDAPDALLEVAQEGQTAAGDERSVEGLQDLLQRVEHLRQEWREAGAVSPFLALRTNLAVLRARLMEIEERQAALWQHLRSFPDSASADLAEARASLLAMQPRAVFRNARLQGLFAFLGGIIGSTFALAGRSMNELSELGAIAIAAASIPLAIRGAQMAAWPPGRR